MKPIRLQLFATNTTASNTTGNDLSDEMKTYYEKRLIDIAEPKLVHDQFGDKYPIPQGNGKTVEFRKYDSLAKASSPISEGVTPNGNSLNVSAVSETVMQYGDWIQLSDMLEMSAVDNNVLQSTRLLGAQAGRTLDSITRDVLAGGTNVIYAPKWSGTTATDITSRVQINPTCRLTPDLVFRAAAQLKGMNADPIDDCFVAIIHPYVAYDLMRSEEWIDAHKYASAENLYTGEIGKLAGVRFVESTEAKIFSAKQLSPTVRTLTVSAYASNSTATATYGTASTYALTFTSALGSTYMQALVGQDLCLKDADNGNVATVKVVGTTVTSKIAFLQAAPSFTPASGDVAFGPGAGDEGTSVYATIVLGAHAYAVTELEGGGLTHIVKQLGYGDDPLNQRSSVGWKATKAAKRLVEQYMVRIESASTYSPYAAAN